MVKHVSAAGTLFLIYLVYPYLAPPPETNSTTALLFLLLDLTSCSYSGTHILLINTAFPRSLLFSCSFLSGLAFYCQDQVSRPLASNLWKDGQPFTLPISSHDEYLRTSTPSSNTMSSTMTMQHTQTPSLERVSDFHSISREATNSPESSELQSSIAGSVAISSAYQMYPGLQTTVYADRTPSTDKVPPRLNRPRKLSGSSEYSLSSSQSSSTGITRSRSPSWASGTSHESVGPLTWKPAYMQTHKPAPLKLQRSRARAADLCASLPGEVLEVILEMLQQLHLDQKSESCATCWMRDACSVAVCSRKWSKAAQLIL